jgi:hypothetical protein
MSDAMSVGDGTAMTQHPEVRRVRLRSRICRPGLSRSGLAALGLLAGCSSRSAPATVLFGAYFPYWLLFGMMAIVFAMIARAVAGIAGFAHGVPFPLFTFLAIGILVAGGFDLFCFGR